MDATWKPETGTGLLIASLLPGHILRLVFLAAEAEGDSLTLEYEVVPAVGHGPSEKASVPGGVACSYGDGWWLSGYDDLGTEYDAPSGAYGPSPDGKRTEGVLGVYPLPPPEVLWLELVFHGPEIEEGAEESRYVVRVPLPLPALTDEEWARRGGW